MTPRWLSRWRYFTLCCFFALWWSASTTAVAQPVLPVPTLTAQVIDQTSTLTAQEIKQLQSKLQAMEQRLGTQMVVLMVPTTAPEEIASYSHRVASTWKIGRKEVGDGLLLVIALHDRRMRFEVARTLEGSLPDLAVSRIIEQQLTPSFRKNQYAQGIDSAIDQVMARIQGEPFAQVQANDEAASSETDLEGLAIFLFFGVTLIAPFIRRIFGNKFGSFLVGTGAGLLAFFFTASLLLALIAGLIALVFTLLFNGSSGGGHGGPWTGGGSGYGGGGGWGGSSGGGGFSSGGGGSFGGGGASGSW